MDLQALERNYRPGMSRKPEQKPEQKQPEKKQKDFFTDLLSTLTGAGGTAAGAALGTALLPGIGTLIGAGLGGALGSAGGEVAENAMTGDDLMKNVGTEAALGGVFGAGPIRLLKAGAQGVGALRGARAAQAATEASAGAKTLEEVLASARPPAASPSRFSGETMAGVDELAALPKSAITPQNIPITDYGAGGLTPLEKPTVARQLHINPTDEKINEVIRMGGRIKYGNMPFEGTNVRSSTPYIQSERTKIPIRTPVGEWRFDPPKPAVAPPVDPADIFTTEIVNGIPMRRLKPGASMVSPAAVQQAATEVASSAGQTVASPASSTVMPGKLQQFANTLTVRGSGLKPGKGVGDMQRVDEAANVYQRYGITGTPAEQLRKLQETTAALDAKVNEALAGKPSTINGSVVRQGIEQIKADPSLLAQVNLGRPGVDAEINGWLTKFDGARDAVDVNKRLAKVNEIVSKAEEKIRRGDAASITDKEAAAMAVKQATNTALMKSYPEIRPFKQDMAVLMERNPQTSAQFGKGTSVPIIGGMLRTPAAASRWAQSKAGAILSNVGSNAANPYTMGKAGLRIGPASMMLSGLGQSSPDSGPSAPDLATAPQDLESVLGAQDTSSQETAVPQYTYENMIADIQRDPKNAKDYMGTYSELQKMTTPKTPKLTTGAIATITDTNKGLQAISDLQKMVGSSDYAGGKIQGTLRQFNPFDQTFKTQQAMVDTARQLVGKAMEGGVLRKEDEEKYRKILPVMDDDATVAQAKLKYLQNLIGQNLQQYIALQTRNGGSPSSLEEALSGAY